MRKPASSSLVLVLKKANTAATAKSGKATAPMAAPIAAILAPAAVAAPTCAPIAVAMPERPPLISPLTARPAPAPRPPTRPVTPVRLPPPIAAPNADIRPPPAAPPALAAPGTPPVIPKASLIGFAIANLMACRIVLLIMSSRPEKPSLNPSTIQSIASPMPSMNVFVNWSVAPCALRNSSASSATPRA